jgi:hypothetical protein
MGMRMRVVAAIAAVVLASTAHAFDPEPPQGIGMDRRATKPCGQEQAGYRVVPATDAQGAEQLVVEPYYPRPGDILLYDNCSKILSLGFRCVGSDAPIHAAMVIARRDGTPAILEVGPNSQPHAFTKTYIVDVLGRLQSYPGVVLVRRGRFALSPDQSAALTCFAEAQQGKEFAVGRLLLQATPFRSHSGWRKKMFADTYLDRRRWICSENVVAAGTIAGIFNPKDQPASAMYPRDLAFDETYDLRDLYEPARLWVRDGNPQIEGDKVTVERP